jgi:hypothetical protein
MLDTNIFNRVLDGRITIEEMNGLRIVATHVQSDELSATGIKSAERAKSLLSVLDRIEPEKMPTSSMVSDVSRWGKASWPADDGIFQARENRLRELDAQSRKKHRDELNPLRDVLIAETALKNDLVFVSEDRNLRTVVEEFGGVAMDIATMLASRG